MVTLPSAGTEGPRGRAAVRGAFLGFLIDNFDIYLPVVALAPAIGYFIPPTLDPGTVALATSWIFVATLVGRPLGALIFGTLGDSIGRRKATLIAVGGFGVVTLVIGLLPGYESWGAGSIVVLVVLRFVDGVFLGGEYSGANVLAMEESAKERRGAAGGLLQAGATVAWVLMSLVTLGVFQFAAPGDVHSAYSQWGWRISFFIGSALAMAFVLYYRRKVEESSIWVKAPTNKLSALTLVRGRAAKIFLQVFVLMTGLWLLLDCVTALIPGVLASRAQLSSSQITVALIIMYSAITIVFLIGGRLSQRFGRRTYFIVTGLGALLLGVPAYALVITSTGGGFGLAVLFATLAGIFIVAPWAVVTPYLAERFHTENRAAGFGLGYSLAVIIPAFYASYQLGLAKVMPAELTVLVLVVIGSVLVVTAAMAGPETKHVDFSVQPETEPRGAPAASS